MINAAYIRRANALADHYAAVQSGDRKAIICARAARIAAGVISSMQQDDAQRAVGNHGSAGQGVP